MKIKTIRKTYDEVMALPRPKRRKPFRPWLLLTTVIRILAQFDVWATRFTFEFPDKMKLRKEPCLILMNHSSFIDLKLASRILYPKPFGIVCTADALVGKSWLMRLIGCIPTQKYVNDTALLRDMKYALEKKKISVLLYPEAGYSLDGCATAIPAKFGRLVKYLNVPVVMITTYGAFARDPLYNGLQLRNVKVSADVRCLVDQKQIAEKSTEELDDILKDAFSFDAFAWQRDNKVAIEEPFRADGLERVLYKCCECESEGTMKGKGTELYCSACGKRYHLDRFGQLQAKDGKTKFPHIPNWFRWQRDCVREEVKNGTYCLDISVDIGMIVDYKGLYMIGKGRLVHDNNGFVLYDDAQRELYRQKPMASFGLCADFFGMKSVILSVLVIKIICFIAFFRKILLLQKRDSQQRNYISV